MGYWWDFLFGPDDEDPPVPVTATMTCPVCREPSDKRHCQAKGCTWFLCIPCGLILAPRGTRRWNGPPRDPK